MERNELVFINLVPNTSLLMVGFAFGFQRICLSNVSLDIPEYLQCCFGNFPFVVVAFVWMFIQ